MIKQIRVPVAVKRFYDMFTKEGMDKFFAMRTAIQCAYDTDEITEKKANALDLKLINQVESEREK